MADTPKIPITTSTVTRTAVVAGGIIGGPQVLVPIIHQWDLVHYAATPALMPDGNFEWSVATVVIGLLSILPSLFIRGRAILENKE